jgi:hypothetical protein
MNSAPRFACDVMLGRTARWLRMLGFDTFYDNKAEDEELKKLCLGESRVLLTKDVALHESLPAAGSHLVRAVRPLQQLEEIAAVFGLARFSLPCRCSLCNGELLPVAKEQVSGQVPAYVFRTQEAFQRCGGCAKLYWPGTHAGGIARLTGVVRNACG